jgi:hypothetical protein
MGRAKCTDRGSRSPRRFDYRLSRRNNRCGRSTRRSSNVVFPPESTPVDGPGVFRFDPRIGCHRLRDYAQRLGCEVFGRSRGQRRTMLRGIGARPASCSSYQPGAEQANQPAR